MSDDICDSYLTLDTECTHEIRIKGSRFIALGYPVSSEAAALAILEDVRKREHAASHHCFAYVIGPDKKTFKYSDDGEPSGTAGRPIHQAIMGNDLTDVLIVVVRYFGGTKLGTGGLTRAYSQAAVELLRRARVRQLLVCDRLRFSLPFTYYDRLMRIISRGEYKILSQDFAEQVTLEIEIRKSHTETFISRVRELTGGQVAIAKNG